MLSHYIVWLTGIDKKKQALFATQDRSGCNTNQSVLSFASPHIKPAASYAEVPVLLIFERLLTDTGICIPMMYVPLINK
jgi:hypothetical protein